VNDHVWMREGANRVSKCVCDQELSNTARVGHKIVWVLRDAACTDEIRPQGLWKQHTQSSVRRMQQL